jgi:ferric-dicitrate binding protein FerR (iron transport regulator)
MKKEDFIELLHKYNLGKSSEEEQQFLISYYHLFDTEPDVLPLLNGNQKNALKKEIHDSIWNRISLHEKEEKHAKFQTSLIVKISAALLLLIISTTAMTYYLLRPSELATIVMKVEKGEENRLIHLPDGSTALVFAGSQLSFPTTFEGMQKREVDLEGKAYFDVKEDTGKKFIIHTEDLKTRVLGTSFFIDAYPNNEYISVNVMKGRVEVSNKCKTFGVLTIGDKLIYNKELGDVVHEQLKIEKQDLKLDDVSLEEAIVHLEKQFNVTIECREKTLLGKRFTTTLLKE